MHIVFKILIGLGILLAIALVAALFVPKDYSVERRITINRPADSVFAYVKMLRNQADWSKWSKMDPNMKVTYTGTDGQPGFKYAWESEKKDVGSGDQTIKRVDEAARSVEHDLHFVKPFEAHADVHMQVIDKGGASEVAWGFKSRMPYPFNLMLAVTSMKNSIGKDFDEGLNNMKAILEK